MARVQKVDKLTIEKIEQCTAALIRGLSASLNVSESDVIERIDLMLGDPQPGDPGFIPFLDSCSCAPHAGEDAPAISSCACQL